MTHQPRFVGSHVGRNGCSTDNKSAAQSQGASKELKKAYAVALEVWKANKRNFDVKPRPRPEWKLTSPPKMQEHEIDARWGLEYTLANL